VETRRERLDRLTARWRSRHDAHRPPSPDARPPADPERERRARDAFPYRDVSPAEYAAAHGHDMPGFTYDEAAYADPELDAWLLELGEILRRRRAGDRSG
jgi:hypothetical protein